MLAPARTNYFAIWREYGDGRRVLQDWRYRRWKLFLSAFLPHPGLIVAREQYQAVGWYRPEFRVAADHDMILRLTGRWRGLRHSQPLVTMLQGGFSETNMLTSLREFREVTVGHGLPRAVAAGICQFKKRWWMMKT